MSGEHYDAEDIPSDGVGIGGNDSCDHETYRRVGSDGGGNIYFNCTGCSRVVLKYDSTATGGGMRKVADEDDDSELYPESSAKSKPQHDPLVKGLSLDSGSSKNNRDQSQNSGQGDGNNTVLKRLKSTLNKMIPKRDSGR